MKNRILGVLLVGGILFGAGCGHLQPRSFGERANLSPIENYKQKRFRDAVQGLDFETGRVRVVLGEAAKVLSSGPLPTFEEELAEANRLLNDNAYVESIAAFRMAVLMRPTSRDALVGLAKSLQTKGEIAKGIAALRTALDTGAKDAETKYLLGEFLWQDGRWREAKQVLSQVTAMRPLNHEDARFIGEAWRMLASAYWYEDNPRLALEAAHRAAEYGVETPPQLINMIEERLNQGGQR